MHLDRATLSLGLIFKLSNKCATLHESSHCNGSAIFAMEDFADDQQVGPDKSHRGPKILEQNKAVRKIVWNLESISRCRSETNKLVRCEQLILMMVSRMRKTDSDHLLHTTALWALINMLKFNPGYIRQVMLQAGVPTILSDILRGKNLTVSAKTYASRLFLFLW